MLTFQCGGTKSSETDQCNEDLERIYPTAVRIDAPAPLPITAVMGLIGEVVKHMCCASL